MLMKCDQEKVQMLLTEAITVLCKNGLSYKSGFSVEGLIGITLFDDDQVFLVSIKETIHSEENACVKDDLSNRTDSCETDEESTMLQSTNRSHNSQTISPVRSPHLQASRSHITRVRKRTRTSSEMESATEKKRRNLSVSEKFAVSKSPVHSEEQFILPPNVQIKGEVLSDEENNCNSIKRLTGADSSANGVSRGGGAGGGGGAALFPPVHSGPVPGTSAWNPAVMAAVGLTTLATSNPQVGVAQLCKP